jgi:uncharacterized protein (TIGR00369 family)
MSACVLLAKDKWLYYYPLAIRKWSRTHPPSTRMNLLLDQSAEIVTHSHTVTWNDPYIKFDEIARMSGLAYLQHLMNTGRAAPISALMNMRGVCFERGKAVFEGTPADYHYNPIGVVHGGFAATLLDSALGCAVHTTLEAGFAYTTVELKVNYVRALRSTTGVVRCEGSVIHVGGRIATAEARLTDASGKLYAHGSTTCLITALRKDAG